jgi:pimeloyl-ACP methyl ester carboxylesterase
VSTQPVVVLVHGAVERGSGFSSVVELLDDFDVITYDRIGHGVRWREGTASIGDDVVELLELIGDRSVTAVGHSLGGLVVMGAAIERPVSFDSIGLYETAIPWADWWSDSDRASMIIETNENLTAANEEPTTDGERRAVAWQCCRRQVIDAFDGPFSWQDLSVPIVTGRGKESRGSSARDASLVAEFFGATVVQLPEANHRAHRGDPTGFADFVRACVAVRNDFHGNSK